MLRFALVLALAGALCAAPIAPAADAQPTPVERQLAIQNAMANARRYLDANQPVEAVAVLEKELSNADGSKTFLTLLREAYLAELYQLEKAPVPDQKRLTQTRGKFALLGGEATSVAPPAPAASTAAPAAPAAAPGTTPEPNLGPSLAAPAVEPTAPISAPAAGSTSDAGAAFKQGNYADADRLFAAVGATKLTADEKAAWAYCRIKLSADRVNAPACDAGAATAAVQEVTAALQLVPQNAGLQKVGQQVLKAAQAKGGTMAVAAPVAAGADVLETANFRVHHGGNSDLGAAVARAAEEGRKQIFERWSGPPGGAWQAKCDIVIHPTADAYAKATGAPAALTGHASVGLTDGRPTTRRIDLRGDDRAVVPNALPRELTHVVLADLFADKPPPKWALEGMAILAGSPEEISRYTRTLTRCASGGELRNLAALFELKDFPADKITGFYCQSVSVTEYLIKLKGERNFKIFLSDAQRYGTAQALKRQYEIDGPQALEAAWKRVSLVP